eukprot:Clim_evm14s29 gene=Clim_evmTU14s29
MPTSTTSSYSRRDVNSSSDKGSSRAIKLASTGTLRHMEGLIPLLNKLQDVFNLTMAGTGSSAATDSSTVSEVIQLPQIVVVGAQSSGKSSVLENIVGRDFLPRGTGIVTRRPLNLQLIQKTDRLAGEHAEFLHKPGKKYYNFEEVRQEIQAETERVCGSGSLTKGTANGDGDEKGSSTVKAGVSSQPINLRIYSPRVLNLSLVDLPGLTRVATNGQGEDISKEIHDMVLSYIRNPNAIILAISPANYDIANSEALRIAKTVDPDGMRTIGVLTKVDIMDHGTDCVDILTGQTYPLSLGFVAVVNRSQRDIMEFKDIDSALRDEEDFFRTHLAYSKIHRRYCGTAHLAHKLQKLLMAHVRDALPALKSRVKTLLTRTRAQLRECGEPLKDRADKSAFLLQVLNRFSGIFTGAIDGGGVGLGSGGNASGLLGSNGNVTLNTTELSGGARICYIFHEIFGHTLENVDPLDGLEDRDILTAILNATGPRPSLFLPEASFEQLVKRQIRRLEEPSLRCCELIYDELIKILGQCEETPELLRFSRLRERIREVVVDMIRRRLPSTNRMIESLVAIELSYINTNHPDFLSSGDVLSRVRRTLRKDHHAHRDTGVKLSAAATPGDHESDGSSADLATAAAGASGGPSGTTANGTHKSRRGKHRHSVNVDSSEELKKQFNGGEVSGTGSASGEQAMLSDDNVAFAGDNSQHHHVHSQSLDGNNKGGGIAAWVPFFGGGTKNTASAPSASEAKAGGNGSSSDVQAGAGHAGHLHQSYSQQYGRRLYDEDDAIARESRGVASLDDSISIHQMFNPDRKHLLLGRLEMETELIKSLICAYFDIVRKNIQDAIPKAIMHFLVNEVRDNLQATLVGQLYNQDMVDTLLVESADTAIKRAQTQEFLQALERAWAVLGEVRDMNYAGNSQR